MVAKGREVKLPAHKVHTFFLEGASPVEPVQDRRYTLTHSDRTGHLYVSIGSEYNQSQISGPYTRWMRDEVLGQWSSHDQLDIHVHVSGGRVYGRPAMRNRTFIRELPLALRALHYADQYFTVAYPDREEAAVMVHFHSDVEQYDRVEQWGHWKDYALPHSVRRESRRL